MANNSGNAAWVTGDVISATKLNNIEAALNTERIWQVSGCVGGSGRTLGAGVTEESQVAYVRIPDGHHLYLRRMRYATTNANVGIRVESDTVGTGWAAFDSADSEDEFDMTDFYDPDWGRLLLTNDTGVEIATRLLIGLKNAAGSSQAVDAGASWWCEFVMVPV